MKIAKKWILIFFTCVAVFIGIFAIVSYKADKFGYWEIQRAEIDHLSSYNRTTLQRHVKVNYIKRNPDKYSAVIFGGSNAGAIDPNLLEELTGNKTYNFYNDWGNMNDYLLLAQFCIKTMPNLKEIFVQISNEEEHAGEKDFGHKLPSIVTGKPAFIERVSALFYNNPIGILTDFIGEEKKRIKRAPLLELYVPSENKNPKSYREDSIDGKLITYYQTCSNELVLKNVLTSPTAGVKFDDALPILFERTQRNFSTAASAVHDLEQIKLLCEQNNIKLTVAIGATFISKKSGFEGEQYYAWLKQLVSVTPLWDFSGFSEANLNPFNFYEAFHYNYETADEMLNVVYGKKQNEDFGSFLTTQNVDSYIEKRRAQFATLKAEYDATGTVQLPPKEKSFRYMQEY